MRGGFHERVSYADAPLEDPRRARVQPRQVYSFARSAELGWRGDAAELVTHGLNYFLSRYRRPDGLFRTLVGPDGGPMDERAVLYDHAFVLLALATCTQVLGRRPSLVHEARVLREAIFRRFERVGSGFETAIPAVSPLPSNPHLHLLEASLAWIPLSGDPEWRQLADDLAGLALTRFIDQSSGAVREYFSRAWSPAPGIEGRIVEPGHQFEWGWVLLRWGPDRSDARRAALRLIELGEEHGVHRGVALNALLDDFSIHDPDARLWPQTERLKAAALAARLTGETRYWTMAAAAAQGLMRYLDTPVAGLWYDRLTAEGKFIRGARAG